MEYPIPTDWDGVTYTHYLICWPCSVDYGALLRGQITALTRGRFWDGKTGNIKAQQALMQSVIDLNIDSQGVTMGCADLITALDNIAAKIEAIETVQISINNHAEASASSAAELNLQVIALSRSMAIAQAWSQSIAQAWASATVYNQVNIEIWGVSPTQPHDVADQEDTGISTTLADPNQLCDRIIYFVDYWEWWVAKYIELYGEVSQWSVGIAQALFGGLMAVAAKSLGGGIPILAAATIAAIAERFIAILYSDAPIAVFTLYLDWLQAHRTDIICTLYNGATNGDITTDIQTAMVEILDYDPLPEDLAVVFKLMFNRSILALLYFEGFLPFDVPTTTFDCDGLCGV